ncbi:MAG: hypothetical protein NC432_02595 [Roseburia sp.]|nr:hypothetical protein [Roseburia sp.]MCM1097150.1 hypothetical protein [Ruminococcus flavefaciens]
MKKLLDVAVTLILLTAGVFLLVSGGSRFGKLISGSGQLSEGESFSQAEGKYISYEASYPVASYEEEYYSGDPSRVKTMGYLVYDESRKAFLYITVPEQKDGSFSSLLRGLQLGVEMRNGRDMSPALAEGTVERADEEMVKRIQAAIEDSEIVGLYLDCDAFSGEDLDWFRETYFGDSYGKVLLEMGDELIAQSSAAEYYYLNSGSVGGMTKFEIWVTMLAAALSLLLFAARLISMLTGGKAGKERKASEPQSPMQRLLAAQEAWVENWCEDSLARAKKLAYLSAAGSVVVLLAIGILAHAPSSTFLTMYFPLGILIGEGMAVVFWTTQKGRSKPEKILGRLEKSIRKELPSAGEQDAFAEDFLNAGQEWVFRERSKETMRYGKVGERYWATFSDLGGAVIVDSSRLTKIETETVSGQVRSGKVRVSYVSYVVRFFYPNEGKKRGCDKEISFNTEDVAGKFMVLAKRRVGDRVEVSAI